MDSLLCENNIVTLGVAEDMLPELSNFIQIRWPSLRLHTLAGPIWW